MRSLRKSLRFATQPLRTTVRRAQRYWLGTITSVATKDNVVAITFDDGPHPEFTPKLLELLRRYAAKATFFMVGEAAERYPELVA